MHCPQCGLQQSSDRMRFCRECGFSLSGVKELVIPDARAAKARKTRFEAAFNQGLLLMLVSLILAIVLTILQDAQLIPKIYTKIVAAFFIVAGLLRMFSPYLMSSDTIDKQQETPPRRSDDQLETTKLSPLLSEAHSMPVTNFNPRGFDTAEVVGPPGVTENTTKSLDKSPERE